MGNPSIFNNFIRLLVSFKFRYIYAGIRRRLFFYFRKSYCREQSKQRKGACSGTGHCCKNVLPWCGYFKNGKCEAYEKQPYFCKVFPLDEKDQFLSGVKDVCGYYFK